MATPPSTLAVSAALAATLATLLSAAALAAPPTCATPAEPAMDAVVATYTGGKITLRELDATIADELCQARLEHAQKLDELRRQALNRDLAQRVLSDEAKRRALPDVERLLVAELGGKSTAPSEARLRAFYDEHRDRMNGASFEEVRDRIAGHLQQEESQASILAFIDTLRAQAKVAVKLPDFRLSVDAVGPSRGPAKAPVTIVTFAEFECPYCARGAETLEKVRVQYGDKVRVVYRDFPLEFHQRAVPAATAARCAAAQGRFWEMHDRLFGQQRALDDASLRAHAEALKLDLAKYDACVKDPRHAAAIAADHDAGRRAGVTGTPAFFINGIPLHGAQPVASFTAIIDRELAAGGDKSGAKKR